MKIFKTHSADETYQVGELLGKALKKGDLVCLSGDLGTGKTAFTQGIAMALGVKGYVTSPTFTIVNEYQSKVPLYHFDVYRISDPEEMYEIGFEEYLDGRGVVVIEWAELIKPVLPKDNIWVEIKKEFTEGPDVRIINIKFSGDRYKEVINYIVTSERT